MGLPSRSNTCSGECRQSDPYSLIKIAKDICFSVIKRPNNEREKLHPYQKRCEIKQNWYSLKDLFLRRLDNKSGF